MLEAVVIGVVILGATFFAVSFQAPPSPDQNPGTEQTQQTTYGALNSLNDLYIDDARYNHSALSLALAEAAAGNKTPLVESIGAFMPAQAKFCVHLNNGHDRIELHCPSDPGGSAVGVSYPIEPNWRFHYGETDLRYVDQGGDVQLGVKQIPIMNAHTVHDEGEYVNVSIGGEQAWRPGTDGTEPSSEPFSAFRDSAYASLLQGDDDADYPSASIYMECLRPSLNAHEPCYASDLARNMSGYQPFASGSDGEILRFTVDNTGPGTVPANTVLEIDFPVGLDLNRPLENTSGFANVTIDGEDSSSPETVRAEIDSELGTGNVSMDIEVNVTDTRYAYKHVDARLSDGAVSHSQLLLRVQNKTAGEWTGGDDRRVMISTPKPAGSADAGSPTGRWGVVMPIPYARTSLDDVQFSVTDGDELLDATSWPDDFNPPPATGTGESRSVLDGTIHDAASDEFSWSISPNLDYRGYTFAEFQFEVTSDGTQTRASERFPTAQPEATFDSFDPPPASIQTKPGIWWRAHPPADGGGGCGAGGSGCPGYANEANLSASDTTETRAFATALDWRNVPLEGEANYTLADLKDTDRQGVRDALRATGVSSNPDRLAPGDTTNIHINTKDLAHYVADTTSLSDMKLESKIYAPWGIPNRTPVETIDHGRVAGGVEAPNDILPLYLDGDNVEDFLTASTDGNVYGVHADSGEAIASYVFGLPEGSGAGQATPTVLSHGTESGGDDVIAVGTSSDVDQFYTIDGDLEQRWKATKPGENRETRSIHVGDDVTGDGHPEVLLATNAKNVSEPTAHEQARLTLWEGQDLDGDGNGDLLDGWGWDYDNRDFGVVVNGEPSEMGMAKMGVDGQKGVWTDTGPNAGTNVMYVKNQTEEAVKDGDVAGAATQFQNTTITEEGSGFYGFSENGNELLNLSGVRVVRAETVEEITDGSKHSGIAIGGANGWTWGLNASGTSYPVTGEEVAGIESRTDVSMGNKLDGYLLGRFQGESSSYMQATSSAFTARETVWWDGEDMVAVDTPEGGYRSNETAISWWAGTKGGILRSTDRLETIENKGGGVSYLVGQIVSDGPSAADVSRGGGENVQLSSVNFTGVHAVDEDNAWFVGQGVAGTDLEGKGIILRTYDGGESYQAVEVTCGSLTCNLQDIDHDGKHLWVAGGDGTVLVSNVSGMAEQTRLEGEADVVDDGGHGAIEIPLRSETNVSIDNVTVTWDPRTSVTYGEAVQLANGTSGDRDLWHADKGCPSVLGDPYTEADPYTEEDTCSETWGYDHANTLRVRDYVQDSGDGVNRTLDGTGNLTIGPFTDGVTGYYGPDWYNNSVNLPLTFHVNLTFSDATEDTYTVHINKSGGINTAEASAANWTYPSQLPNGQSFSTPSCFGRTTDGCPTIESINVTNVGTANAPSYVGVAAGHAAANGTALYQLAKGSASWSAKSMPISENLNDAAVAPQDPSRWVVGAADGRVLVSYDGGKQWQSLPSDMTVTKAVDLTDPSLGHLVGGQGTGEYHTLNGYVSSGTVETVDLYDEANHGGMALEKVNISSLPTIAFDRGGDTPVEIEVWDENAGSWGTVYEPGSGKQTYNFTAATTNVTLRFQLAAESLRKQSPLVRGDIQLQGHDDDNLTAASSVSFGFALTDRSQFGSGLDQVNYDAGHGYMMLKTVQNPWLLQLGNEDEGDWSTVRNGTVGARVADMQVDTNGTIWVVTEGIYDHDAATDATTVQDAACGSDTDCFDNTLYAIDPSTGEVASWWDPMHFSQPPQELAVGDDSLSVVTGNENQESYVHWMEFDDPRKDNNVSFGFKEEAPLDLITSDAWPSHTQGQDDPIVSAKHSADGTGAIYGFRAPGLGFNWEDMPALNDEFTITYDVPADALYGSRVVVTEVRWTTDDEHGTEIVQTGRLHDTFGVTPGGGEMPLVPTYTLEVVAWIEDWR